MPETTCDEVSDTCMKITLAMLEMRPGVRAVRICKSHRPF